MNSRSPLQPGTDQSDVSSVIEKQCVGHESGVWTREPHVETSIEKSVRRTLHRIYFVGVFFAVVCISVLIVAGLTIYRQATYVDPVTPDYSLLNVNSDVYWTDRILLDIETARQSAGTDEQRSQRLRLFADQTVNEALEISSPYFRAQAVTSVAMVLAQHDISIVLDHQLQRLGSTPLIVSMRARVLISQALKHLRQQSPPAAQIAMQQYNRLVADADLQLNSPINEESFFGTVTVLRLLNDRDGLRELFDRQTASIVVLGHDQRMRGYRLIAGEQVRAGMIAEALETAKRINNQIELARAWALILQYSARPPIFLPVEPVMLELLDVPSAVSQAHTAFAERAADEIFHYLAENKEINTQASLLQRLAGSLFMRDAELLEIVRLRLIESKVLNDRVKQSVLRFLDAPELSASSTDSALDDWASPHETVRVEIVNIDPTPLRTRTDQQWIQAQLAIAQGHQSIRRFHDADRVLKQAFVTVQRFVDPNIRTQLLLRIGEQQVAIGSITDARQTFTAVAPGLGQNRKGDLARLQIIARFFEDAWETLSSIETPANREDVSAILLREQIRLNRLDDAEQTLSLMPQGRAAEARSRLNIARERASREDFNALRLPIPEENNHDWERSCIGLIQHGFLRLADQTASRVSDVQKRTDLQTRISGEYLLLYQAFNNVNDPNRAFRWEIRQEILSVAERAGQPVIQAAILTELLVHLTEQLRTEEDRTDGKRLWTEAIDICRRITEPGERAILFAQLIVAKNMLDNPNFAERTFPLFTRATNPSAVEETNRLIEECLELVNSLESEEQHVHACVHLARALAQIDRTTSAQTLLDHALDIAANIPDREASVSILLLMIPTLNAMNSADVIPVVYRLAIDRIADEFTSRSSPVDEFEWRMRDSNIERIIRSQMENGFVNDAIESANRLNEPLLRDRLLRAAAYVYLDLGDINQAELTARRITVREIQNGVIQNIQTVKRQSENRLFVPKIEEQLTNH